MQATRRNLRPVSARENEEPFHLLAEHAQDVIYRYRIAPPRGFEYVNPAVTRLTGYTPDEHYADHVSKPFYPPLKEFMTGGPLIAAILSGDQAIEVVRTLVGATDGRKAAAGTIRGDLSLSNRENLVHASDSPDSAKREIALWFPGH